MRLICPNCVAQYEVDEDVIPPEGRDVQCANCGHNWFQDSLKMLSPEAAAASENGDPDSDVPAELFNDLEGKLDSQFVSKRAQPAPDPKDVEPQEAPDDFQVERTAALPSSRLDQEALDMLRAEAEYSSGEKPPAATQEETAEQSPEPTVEDEPVVDAEDPPVEPVEQPTKAEAVNNDLDEIRRRIMEMETYEPEPEPTSEQQPEEAAQPVVQEPLPEPIEEPVVVAEDVNTEPAQAQPAADNGNPFSRPTTRGVRTQGQNRTEKQYEENIPQEEPVTQVAKKPVDDAIIEAIDNLEETQEITGTPFRKVSSSTSPEKQDDLYGVSKERHIPRKDMLPDIDVLSSEIAQEAEQTTYEYQPVEDKSEKAKTGFFKGFVYALLLYGVIAVIYLQKGMIVEYIPQAEGVLNILSNAVDKAAALISPIVDMLKQLIG